MIFQKLWVDRCGYATIRVVYFKHHVTGEAWPADSDSTLNFKGGSRRGGESKGVKFRIIRKRREPFSSLEFHVLMREQVPLRQNSYA